MESPPLPSASSPVPQRASYFAATRTATYSFLISLPLLVLYEVLIAFVNRGQLQQIRIGAELWIKQLVALVGGTGVPVLAILVVGIGVLVVLAERKRRPPLVGRFFGWMLIESLVYAVVLALLVSSAVGALFAYAAPQQMQQLPVLTQLALSLGAGLYEELVFRVVLVGGLFWILKRVMVPATTPSAPTVSAGMGDTIETAPSSRYAGRRMLAYTVAAIVGAFLFSSVHYIGSLGDPFTLPSFTYRFFFGLALNVVFLLRGFGIAAWAHALYDVTVVLGVWGN